MNDSQDPWINVYTDDHDVCHVNIAGVDYLATEAARRLAAYDGLLAALEALYAECDPRRKEWYLMATSEGMEQARTALIAARGER